MTIYHVPVPTKVPALRKVFWNWQIYCIAIFYYKPLGIWLLAHIQIHITYYYTSIVFIIGRRKFYLKIGW